jgi:biotin carboxylase
LLRVNDEPLGIEYSKLTKKFPQFYIDIAKPIEKEAIRFRAWCEENQLAPDSFCCMSEPRQEYWQAFAKSLGLPCIEPDTIRALRQKPIMKEWIRKSGLNVTPYQEVKSLEEALNFTDAHLYPVVLKPVDGWGTIYTEVLRSTPDLKRAFNQSFERNMMVEKFVPYREYECCALIFEGKVLDVYPSIMPMAPVAAAHGALNANISVANCRDSIPVDDLKGMVQKLADGFELRNGYLHMEFFASDDGKELIIGELALRYPGCEIAKNHGLAYGFNMASATLDVYLGKRPDLNYGQLSCVGDLLLPYKDGYVRNVMSEAELVQLPGVIEAHVGIKVGDRLAKVKTSSFNCSGWVFVQGETPTQVESRMQQVLDAYYIDIF